MPSTRRALLAAAPWAAALTLAACQNDGGPGRCYESGATSYPITAPWNDSLIFHWSPAEYPVRVYAEPTGALPALADSAVARWLGAFRCGELGLVRWTDSTTADIVIRNPPIRPAIIAAQVRFAADSLHACQGRTDGDTLTSTQLIRPLRSYVWPVGIDSAATAACYRFAVPHELGHALGLLQHSRDTADLMYGVPRRREPSVNDRFTIQVLYSYSSPVTMTPR
jgi:predicted Zn-dependent protease